MTRFSVVLTRCVAALSTTGGSGMMLVAVAASCIAECRAQAHSLWCQRTHVRLSAAQLLEDRRKCFDAGAGKWLQDQLHVRDASSQRTRATLRRDPLVCRSVPAHRRARPWLRLGASGITCSNTAAVRPNVARVASSRDAGGIDGGLKLGYALNAVLRLARRRCSRDRQSRAVNASILLPVVPIMMGGPLGRGPAWP